MPDFVGNALFCGQCPVLWAMPTFVGNALSGLFLGLQHTITSHTNFLANTYDFHA